MSRKYDPQNLAHFAELKKWRIVDGLCVSCGSEAVPKRQKCRKCLKMHLDRVSDSIRRQKEAVYSHYGTKCNCCGEKQAAFLTIDHVNNDGNIERRTTSSNGSSVYRRIIAAGFPDEYQVLCMNCNWGKKVNGGICPHKSLTLE